MGTLSILCLQGLASQFGDLDVGGVCCWRDGAGRDLLSPVLLSTCGPRIPRGTELPLQPPECPFCKLGALRVTELLFHSSYIYFSQFLSPAGFMPALSLCLNWHLGSLLVLLCVAIQPLCFGRQSKLRLSSVNLPFFFPCFLSRKPLSHPKPFPHKLFTETISPRPPKCHHLLGKTQVFLNSFAGCWKRS